MPECEICKHNPRGPRGLHCVYCGMHVYWVRAPNGEAFLVTTLGGKRWCTAREGR